MSQKIKIKFGMFVVMHKIPFNREPGCWEY